MKWFKGAPDLLRFSGEGACISVNIPDGPRAGAFLTALDEAAIEAQGRLNLIKNAHTDAETAARAFPAYEEMRTRLKAWDPKRVFRSAMSERLGL
ncbi:MAG: hypothetical protein WDM79_02340 [Terricaulis sp.]